MSNWQDQPATDKQIGAVLHLIDVHMPRNFPEYGYEIIKKLRNQIQSPDDVYLTKGKASEVMGKIRNGYSVDDFKKLFPDS